MLQTLFLYMGTKWNMKLVKSTSDCSLCIAVMAVSSETSPSWPVASASIDDAKVGSHRRTLSPTKLLIGDTMLYDRLCGGQFITSYGIFTGNIQDALFIAALVVFEHAPQAQFLVP